MNRTPDDAPIPGSERDVSEEYARSVFHLRTLYELAQDLGVIESVDDLLDVFLPSAMGPIGLSSGFVVLHDEAEHTCRTATLGIPVETREKLENICPELVKRLFPDSQDRPLHDAHRPFEPILMRGRHLNSDSVLPAGTQCLLALPVQVDLVAIMGFGPKISEESLTPDEVELLMGMARTLAPALRSLHARTTIEELNEDLAAKNLRLERAVDRMERARRELNRRAFHLNTIFDTTFEISGLMDIHQLTDTFLLLCLGALSTDKGFVLLFSSAFAEPITSFRGLDPPDVSGDVLRKSGLGVFVSLKDRMPRTMESRWIEDPALVQSLPLPAHTLVAFTVDEDCRGLIGLGRPMTAEAWGKDEKRLLTSLVSMFMVSVENSLRFETINVLNTDLSQRNVELQSTIDELTSARHEIDLLTAARDRIVAMARGSMQRIEKVSLFDLGLIVAVSLVLALLFNMTRPDGIDLVPPALFKEGPPLIDPAAVKARLAQGPAMLVDARPAEFFNDSHIEGAFNLPLDLFDFVYSMRFQNLPSDQPIIVYGRTISRHYDREVADKLAVLGHDNVYILDGGLDAWQEEGGNIAP